MAFHSDICLDKYYAAMAKTPFDFQYHLQNEFFPTLKKSQLHGGPSRSKRKQVIQEAIDALQIYGTLKVGSAAELRFRFESVYRSFFNSPLPPNTPTAGVQAAKMKLLDLKYYVLEEKFRLLDYWQAVATGTTEPDYGEGGAHWALHEFLQHEPTKVRPVLEIMLGDAASVLGKQIFTAEMSMWKGADYQVQKSFTKTEMSRVLCFDASARAGVELKGHLEMQYSGLKVEADAELLAGAFARAQGNVNISQSGFSAKGKVEAMLGINLKANVNCDIFDVLEMGAEIDALVGALGKAEAEFTIDYNGVAVKVGAEVFAGVRVTASAHGTLKLGGRQITKAKITGSAMAGAGASASAHFKCSIFGEVGFGAKAGTVLGVGGQVDTAISVDFHNIYWGASNLVWTYANEHGFRNRAKIWFLPVEENVQMCLLARDAMFKMMGDIYQQNEAEVKMLERWKMIERRVSAFY